MTDALAHSSIFARMKPAQGKAPILAAVALCALMLASGCQKKPVAETQAADQTPQAAQMEAAAPQEETSAPAQGSDTAPKAPARAVARKADAAEASAAAGKAASIAGGWVNAGGACDSGASVQFNPDGTYMSEGENGTWALDGKTLTVTTSATPEAERVAQTGPEQSTGDSGEKAVLTVLSVTDSSASVILSNGTNANWTRCSG
jgi:hypothetical protein